MKTRQVLFVDGIKTRAAIDRMAKQPEGLTKLCKEKGISNGTLCKICRNGYGTPESIRKYQEAGIPICLSSQPVTSRRRKEHTRNDNKKENNLSVRADSLTFKPSPENPRQLTLDDISRAEEIKELLISHLTALIEDLKKI